MPGDSGSPVSASNENGTPGSGRARRIPGVGQLGATHPFEGTGGFGLSHIWVTEITFTASHVARFVICVRSKLRGVGE